MPQYKPYQYKPQSEQPPRQEELKDLAKQTVYQEAGVYHRPTMSQSVMRRLEQVESDWGNGGESNLVQTGQTRWMIPYADMITLLLALFMVLFALNHFKQQEASQDLITEQQKVLVLEQQLTRARQDLDVLRRNNSLETLNNPLNASTLDSALVQSRAIEADLNRELSELQVQNHNKTDHNKTEPIQGKIEVKPDSRGLVISLTEPLLFAPGSAELNTTSQQTLGVVAKTLLKLNRPIRVEGHTDNTPIATLKYPSNWELSTSRATNIVKYLLQHQHFKPNQLSASGYGEYHPLAENSSIEGKRKNRRVDIVVLNTLGSSQEPVSQNVRPNSQSDSQNKATLGTDSESPSKPISKFEIQNEFEN